MAGLGPESWPTPTCQRLTVLKNFAWSAMSPRKMCGGGKSFGSAHPSAQHASQIPANRPSDAAVHATRGAARQITTHNRAHPGHAVAPVAAAGVSILISVIRRAYERARSG